MAIPTGDPRKVELKNRSTSPLLLGLKADQKNLILRAAERQKFPAKHIIVRNGDPARNLFLLTKGTIKYYRVAEKGDEVLLWWIATGDAFGIGSLLGTPTPYVGTAEAVEDCELLVWNRERIRPLAVAHGRLMENALRITLHYLAAYSDRLGGLITETAEQRLARTILQLANRTGTVRPTGVEFSITNENLAGLANVSPFTASRCLSEWERRGIIEKHRGKIVVLSPEDLVIP